MADKYLNESGLQYFWNKIIAEISSTDKVDIYTFNTTAYSDVSSTINNDKLKAVLMNSNVLPVIRIIRDTNYITLFAIQYSANDGYYIVGLRVNSSDTWAIVSVEAIALKTDIPTATSDLTNDSGFITNTVNNLTNYTDTISMNTLLDNKVSKTGDTMSGMLNINQASGDTGITTKRTDTNVSAFFGVGSGGSAHGVYSNTLAKWLVDANSSGNIYLNGIDFTTAKTGSNALIGALDTASATIIDSTPIITGGNTASTANSAYYRRNASGIKNYIGEQITGTSLITSSSTMTATVTPAHKYDSHGVLEKFGRVCTLDLNCDFSASYSSATKIGTLPTGYRPRVKHSYNIQTNAGTSNPYISINTNGDVQLGGYTGGVGFRAVLTWIVAV